MHSELPARVSKNAVIEAAQKGNQGRTDSSYNTLAVPERNSCNAAAETEAKAFISVELSMGQMMEDVEPGRHAVQRPVCFCGIVLAA